MNFVTTVDRAPGQDRSILPGNRVNKARRMISLEKRKPETGSLVMQACMGASGFNRQPRSDLEVHRVDFTPCKKGTANLDFTGRRILRRQLYHLRDYCELLRINITLITAQYNRFPVSTGRKVVVTLPTRARAPLHDHRNAYEARWGSLYVSNFSVRRSCHFSPDLM